MAQEKSCISENRQTDEMTQGHKTHTHEEREPRNEQTTAAREELMGNDKMVK